MKVMFGVLSIMIALICYSISVWSQVYTKKLNIKHLVLFWAGLVFDAIGTVIMIRISGSFKLNIHGITGIIGFILMAMNAIWATIVMCKTSTRFKVKFHIVSITVWTIWLIPFFTGIFLNVK